MVFWSKRFFQKDILKLTDLWNNKFFVQMRTRKSTFEIYPPLERTNSKNPYTYLLTSFSRPWESKNNFIFAQMRARKFAFEINWPLERTKNYMKYNKVYWFAHLVFSAMRILSWQSDNRKWWVSTNTALMWQQRFMIL